MNNQLLNLVLVCPEYRTKYYLSFSRNSYLTEHLVFLILNLASVNKRRNLLGVYGYILSPYKRESLKRGAFGSHSHPSRMGCCSGTF